MEYVAGLAGLEVGDDGKKELAGQLSRILDYVEQLNRLDVSDIGPAPPVVAGGKNVLRDDRVAARTGSSEAGKTVGLFRVPKVITER